MARALKGEQLTPADELRDLLAEAERQVANLRWAGPSAVRLLENMDRISELLPGLEASGMDLRPELARWKTLQASVRNRSASLVSELRSAGGLAALRVARQRRSEAPWWWRLDAEVASRRRKRLRRAAAIAALVVAVGALVVVLLRVLFPVDPNVRAAYERRNAGEQKALSGDAAGAVAEFRAVTELMPDDVDGWILLGCAQVASEDAAGASASFARARELSSSEVEFRTLRAAAYLAFGLLVEAETDVNAVLAESPDDPTAYYYLSSIREQQGDIQAALAAVERAAALAEQQRQDQLMAMARYRMSVLLQRLPLQTFPSPAPSAAP